jgi:hypothetical protein
LAIEIADQSMTPLLWNDFDHFPIIRWRSEEDGTADITGFWRRLNTNRGDGVVGRIYHNGVEIYAEESYDQPAEIDLKIKSMKKSDFFDFVLDYGAERGGNSQNDPTAYSFLIDHTGSVLLGDFDGSGELDLADIDDLTVQVAGGTNPADYDLNSDAVVDAADITVWINDLFGSWTGDSNLDNEFNSGDLVNVLAAGVYEQDAAAVWSKGDFDGDGRSNTNDLVTALAGGGYEKGPRAAVSAVPEPSSLLLTLISVFALAKYRRRNR